jgi:glyoxylate/hydroxypyruvate reductase A
MRLLFHSTLDDPTDWLPHLLAHASDMQIPDMEIPDMEIQVWPDVSDPAAIDVALVWTPPEGGLQQFPNLRAILSLGAGVNQLDLPSLPDVPLARLIDPGLTESMVGYAMIGVGWFARDMHHFAADQRAGRWNYRVARAPRDVSVGVMGLGELGGAIAQKLVNEGYTVHGWATSRRDFAGVTVHSGQDEFEQFLASSQILVNVLPLTPATRNILDARAFAAMQTGACLINEGRGGHVVEEDLLAALDSGHLAGAMLDVFQAEPPAPDSPLWSHAKVIMTPHIAGAIRPATAAAGIVENCRRAMAGERLVNQVDRDRGY